MTDPGPTWWEILAGACGAIIPIAFRVGLSPRQVVAMGFIGLAFAVFLGPALFDYYNITNPQFRAAITFAMGMGGMRGSEALLRWWSDSADQFVSGIFSRILRPRGGANPRRKERRKSRDRRKTGT